MRFSSSAGAKGLSPIALQIQVCSSFLRRVCENGVHIHVPFERKAHGTCNVGKGTLRSTPLCSCADSSYLQTCSLSNQPLLCHVSSCWGLGYGLARVTNCVTSAERFLTCEPWFAHVPSATQENQHSRTVSPLKQTERRLIFAAAFRGSAFCSSSAAYHSSPGTSLHG